MNYPFPAAHGAAVIGGAAVTSLTTSITVPPGTKMLLVKVAAAHGGAAVPAVSTVAFGAVSLTLVASTVATNDTGGFGHLRSEIWKLENPTAGTANLVTTLASAVAGEIAHLWETWLNTIASPLGTVYVTNDDNVSPVAVGAAPGANKVLTGILCHGTGSVAQSDANNVDNFVIDSIHDATQENINAISTCDNRSALNWSFRSDGTCASAVVLTLQALGTSLDYSNAPPVGDPAVLGKPGTYR
jgi:hypothetical protein